LLAGRELSIRLVYRRPLLFRALLAGGADDLIAVGGLTNRAGRPAAAPW
jgi:hypothetical protein